MAPEDRRAALITATIPLLHEHGLDVSTKQIAQAAGVAEGTIFGVFPDKRSLLVAAIGQAFDPRPTLDAIAAIDLGWDLRPRLSAAATLINDRFAGIARLMNAARLTQHSAHPEGIARMHLAREQMLAALAALVEPDAHRLRREPREVARLLLLFCGANTHGPFGDPQRLDGDELVSLLLDGLLVDSDRPIRETPTGVSTQC
jgi:AcrR family transcriptional regulator